MTEIRIRKHGPYGGLAAVEEPAEYKLLESLLNDLPADYAREILRQIKRIEGETGRHPPASAWTTDLNAWELTLTPRGARLVVDWEMGPDVAEELQLPLRDLARAIEIWEELRAAPTTETEQGE